MTEAEIRALKEQAANLNQEAAAKRAEYKGKEAEMPADVAAAIEKMYDRILDLHEQAQREEKALRVDRLFSEPDPSQRLGGGNPGTGMGAAQTPEKELQYKAFRRALLEGPNRLSEAEYKALSVGTNAEGGFLVAPEEFAANTIIKGVDNLVVIRQRATKFTVTTAKSLGIPTLETDPDDADWTSELGTGNEDSAFAFGKRELSPNPLAKRIKVSKKLLRSVPNGEAFVGQRLAYKFAVSQEKAFMTGTGSNQPLGIFTASDSGIPTSRDVTAINAAAVDADDPKNALMSLKTQYHAKAEWIMHRDIMKLYMKLEDSQGRPLYSDLKDGLQLSLVGRPVQLSEYAPNTVSTGQYHAVLGDFSWYWIVDALDFQIQVLLELYAATNQNGYIGRLETDGAPVLAEAFARLKFA